MLCTPLESTLRPCPTSHVTKQANTLTDQHGQSVEGPVSASYSCPLCDTIQALRVIRSKETR
jgi:hypothetical protein